MLIDLTRCIGCDACTVACKQENGTPVDVFFARVLNVEYGTYPNVKRVYIPVLCNHCDDAPCLKSCPNKAIIRRQDGIVLIDQDRCRGTGACVSACPYGNIYLNTHDHWYLNPDEPYERDFVKPRLRRNVARKCTYCAHRVDEGLDPACVVACPTTARIFGDMDDSDSVISKYIREQKETTAREPFHLLPEAGTKPAGLYLGTMSEQQVSTLGERAPAETVEYVPYESAEPPVDGAHAGRSTGLSLILGLVLGFGLLASSAQAQSDATIASKANALDVYSTTTCGGCHGVEAMGGFGPPLARTKLTLEEFRQIVRKGQGMMPSIPASELSDADLNSTYNEVKAAEWKEEQIPIAYKVGQLLSTKNVSKFFTWVFIISFLFGLKVLWYWLSAAGIKHLMPYLGKVGYAKSAFIALRSLVVDGLLVASLWRRSKKRWFMHGLMLYGMIGLIVADILMAIYNPSRSHLPLNDPLKWLPVGSGIAVFLGALYVKIRYSTDEYIDNGLTLGRDFLFVNLLFHTVFSGFLDVWIGRVGEPGWVMPIHIYHLACVALLMLTAPFTRFQHAFVVPFLVAMTRLSEAVTQGQAHPGFVYEPSPGRHHKSERIASDVIQNIDPDFKGKVRIRYYP